MPEDQHLSGIHGGERRMLQAHGQRQIVYPVRWILIENLSDYIELDEVPAQRPSDKRFPVEAEKYRHPA